MAAFAEFDPNHLRSICDVLGDTADGLTGTEIGQLLSQCGISELAQAVNPNKRTRLYAALLHRQQHDHCGNHVAAFIRAAMSPVRYTSDPQRFDQRRDALNHVLVFSGLSVGEDGEIRAQTAARSLGEAEQRAGRLRAELMRRGVHNDVLKFCRAELVQQNYFHAVFEATKSVADKIRARSSLTGDGSSLIDQAFGLGSAGMPLLAFNTLQTETERSEQSGLMNIMKGMFSAFRNVTAHAPKISWTVTEQDALDLLTIASFLHRRIDSAVRTPRTT